MLRDCLPLFECFVFMNQSSFFGESDRLGCRVRSESKASLSSSLQNVMDRPIRAVLPITEKGSRERPTTRQHRSPRTGYRRRLRQPEAPCHRHTTSYRCSVPAPDTNTRPLILDRQRRWARYPWSWPKPTDAGQRTCLDEVLGAQRHGDHATV